MAKTRIALSQIFVRRKAVEILLAIGSEKGDDYCSRLAVKAHCTYSHATGLLEKMKGAGLLTFEKQDRIKKVKLTDKGIELSKNVRRLMDSLELL